MDNILLPAILHVEKMYRRALAELFDVSDLVRMMEADEEGVKSKATVTVVDMFKRREICRYLSNGPGRLAWAGDPLHDVIVKIA